MIVVLSFDESTLHGLIPYEKNRPPSFTECEGARIGLYTVGGGKVPFSPNSTCHAFSSKWQSPTRRACWDRFMLRVSGPSHHAGLRPDKRSSMSA